MLIIIAIAIGLVGGWVYAGCPFPSKALEGFHSRRRPLERPATELSSAPAPGASTARP